MPRRKIARNELFDIQRSEPATLIRGSQESIVITVG